jgi:uncharacterized protein
MDDATPPPLNYEALLREALLGLVRRALNHASEHGLPGEQHFFISFETQAPGVRVPRHLALLHPKEMTIVLQHQFWNLEVDDDAFSVTLRFNGSPAALTVPFAALTGFADPSVPFGLRLRELDGAEETPQAQPEAADLKPGVETQPAASAQQPKSGSVVDIAAFRKRE